MNEEVLNITLKEVEIQKLDLQPGETLLVTVKHDDIDYEALQSLRKGFSNYFPNNQVMLFNVGTNGDMKLAVMKETVASAPNLGYCGDCNCGKKERLESKE